LLQMPAAVRFVSCEPLLGKIDLTALKLGHDNWLADALIGYHYLPGMADYQAGCGKLDWVIAGCESGPDRRRANQDWFLSLLEQCSEAGIPFFLKQMDNAEGNIVKMPELEGKIRNQIPMLLNS
jgi:protein gp37